MASLINRPNGHRWIQFYDQEKRRQTIRLGKISKRAAEEIKRHVEYLLNARTANIPIPNSTSEWIAGLEPDLRKKLENHHLFASSLTAATLGSLIEYCRQHLDISASTKVIYEKVFRALLEFFSSDHQLTQITPGDADEFLRWLVKTGNRRTKESKPLASSTVARRISLARQFFQAAVRKRWLAENPFAEVSFRGVPDPAREVYVPRETIVTLMDYVPDWEWRLVLALSRFAGLRCPSEMMPLRWEWVNWERSRLTIYSQKNKRFPDKIYRVIPIFPDLRPYLEEAWEQAEEGAELIFRTIRRESAIRRGLERYLIRAGIEQWPKITQSLRASLETDLVDDGIPIHVVTKWLGNSPAVAKKHYLRVHDEHFEAAIQGEAISEAKSEKAKRNPKRTNADKHGQN